MARTETTTLPNGGADLTSERAAAFQSLYDDIFAYITRRQACNEWTVARDLADIRRKYDHLDAKSFDAIAAIVGSDGECVRCGAECDADAAGEYACGNCGVSWTVKAGAQ